MTKRRHLNRLAVNLMKEIEAVGETECKNLPEMFFPVGQSMEMLNTEIGIAKSICNRCPVKDACAEYAIVAEEPFGVWGGLTPAERNVARRRASRLYANDK